jgi:hypothetical protein
MALIAHAEPVLENQQAFSAYGLSNKLDGRIRRSHQQECVPEFVLLEYQHNDLAHPQAQQLTQPHSACR